MSTPALKTYPLEELIAVARAKAPFYREAYAALTEKASLADLPVVDAKKFWEAHQRGLHEILTAPLSEGFVLNSGGSTGAPKWSYFNYEEADSAVALLTQALDRTILQDGDRVANLFAAGSLYASFLFATEAFKAMRARVLQLPIGTFAPLPDAARIIVGFAASVWAGFPSHLLGLTALIEKEGLPVASPRLILFAGEILTPEQRRYLQSRFPGVTIQSIGYASVDGGMIGYVDAGCGPGEHRVYDGATILEILDEETGEPIDEPGQPGEIIFTNLTRKLMPTLRYPTGDRGQWVEPAGTSARKFLLLGRTEESVRLAATTVPVSEVMSLVAPFREKLEIVQAQLLITQQDRMDRLTMRLVGNAPRQTLEEGGREILESLMRQKPLLANMINKGSMLPVQIDWITTSQVEVNPRTGKVRLVIDRREL